MLYAEGVNNQSQVHLGDREAREGPFLSFQLGRLVF